MKTRILFIFALFLMLTGFYGEDRVVEESGINLEERVSDEAVPPSLTEKPKWFVSSDGKEITISARFKGDPKPEIMWFHENKVIVEGKRHSILVGEGIAMLVIRDLIMEDAGRYTIRLKNAGGEVSGSVTLTFTEVKGI